MVWFNVDDGFYDHPKVKAIPREMYGTWDAWAAGRTPFTRPNETTDLEESS